MMNLPIRALFFVAPNERPELRLVTQALLVAVRLHALLAFVFVDFRLTTLLERTHVLWFGLWLV